ncbi:MAG: nitrite reductase [Spirochaetaceae bacterium]|nr:nitrite reductase [Spirochaetaceae bacterium]|tara:strand:- start:74562 stop:75935 length:1374 start_codon:yes stop_codon:yes gene_type:complete
MKALLEKIQNLGNRGLWILLSAGFVVGLVLAFLIAEVAGRLQEEQQPYFQVVELDDSISDPSVWGENFPLHYEMYKRTTDMERTRYGGSEALPHVPDEADPRSVVTQSKIDEDPRLKKMWAGYAFSIDFREERGHAYMLTDQLYTLRQKVGQPGTCLNCHASTYNIYKDLGDGDIMKGFHKMNSMPYKEVAEKAEHPVACIDCHNPKDMDLRVTRPAFMIGIKKVKAKEGISNYDVNEDATRREMRTYVCAQCHVEYYFEGKEKTLTYPWDNGMKADEILAYYDKINFKDWTHKDTGAPALKAQHPEFEMYSQGIHARSGVTCADCHMPYVSEGAYKVSDHHVRSPYLNTDASCGTCHNISPDELRKRIDTIQDTHWQLRNVAMDALMDLISDIEKAQKSGVAESKLKAARDYQRKSQFLLGFVEAENSTGFHAPQESARILGNAIDMARKGQAALR